MDNLNGNKLYESLTEEQKGKIKALRKSSAKKGFFMALKLVSTLFAANLVIALINGLYVQSSGFAFISSLITAFLLFNSFGKELKKEHDRISEEVKKILNN